MVRQELGEHQLQSCRHTQDMRDAELHQVPLVLRRLMCLPSPLSDSRCYGAACCMVAPMSGPQNTTSGSAW
jgi:hypothetical protein